MADDDFEDEELADEDDPSADNQNQASSDILPPNSMLGSDGLVHFIDPAPPQRYTVGKDTIPPNVDPWRLLHRGKSVDFIFNGKRRAVRYGAVKPFESEDEAVAFVRFVAAHREFKFVLSRYQDDTEISFDESTRQFTLTTSGATVPVATLTRPWKQLRSGSLWIVQREYVAVPIEHRTWLFRKSAVPSSKTTGVRYWVGGHSMSDGSRLAEFLESDSWWHGYTKDNFSGEAERVKEAFPQITIGDGFAIKGYGHRGVLKIHLAGRVVEKDASKGLLKIQRNSFSYPKSTHPVKGTGSWFGTLREVTDPSLVDWIFHGGEYVNGANDSDVVDTSMQAPPLNVILYGPPGTGKTFTTAARAVETVDGVASDERIEVMERYNDLQSAGQIAFVTFHQSYAYEDFIEGIRPVMDDSAEGGSPRYECKPGILKEIAARAAFNMLERIPATAGTQAEIPFDVLWNSFLEHVREHPKAKYEGQTSKTCYTMAVSSHGSLIGTNILSPDIASTYQCSRNTMAEIYVLFGDRSTLTGTEIRKKRGHDRHDQFSAIAFREMITFRDSEPKLMNVLEIDDVSSEEEQQAIVQRFLNIGKESGYQIKPAAEWNRYVLIIDEINRGNISKILGELITLLEDDKRLGNENALTVTLPYSRDKFALPANLHIIGTMNTADKSIALVDIALRRRFDFEELVPNFAICRGLSQPMRDVLATLNERITLRKDRDHRIGHAFFVRVNDVQGFNGVWKRKIAPLLLEYFYGDWDGLRYALGEAGSSSTGFVRSLEGSDREARTRFQWHGDTETPIVDALELLAANYRIALNG